MHQQSFKKLYWKIWGLDQVECYPPPPFLRYEGSTKGGKISFLLEFPDSRDQLWTCFFGRVHIQLGNDVFVQGP